MTPVRPALCGSFRVRATPAAPVNVSQRAAEFALEPRRTLARRSRELDAAQAAYDPWRPALAGITGIHGRRFQYQYAHAAVLASACLDPTVLQVFCEHHEDTRKRCRSARADPLAIALRRIILDRVGTEDVLRGTSGTARELFDQLAEYGEVVDR